MIVVRLTLNAKLLLILPVHKRISQIMETTVYLAETGTSKAVRVDTTPHHLRMPTTCMESTVDTLVIKTMSAVTK